MSKRDTATNTWKLGVVTHPCHLSTEKVKQRQEDHEFKGSLEYINLWPCSYNRDPLSVKLRVGPRKMAPVLRAQRTQVQLPGPVQWLTTSVTPVSEDPTAPSGFLEDLHSLVYTPPPRYMHTYNF